MHVDPSLAFEGDNIRLLCQDCHFAEHSDQSTYRKGGTYLYGGPDTIESITPAGVEPVYDLEVEGPWHNFLANGIVVHNCLASRNSASSRAIPVSKQLDRYRGDPAWPISWPAERPGMSGGDELEGDELALARDLFARVHDLTAAAVDEYLADTERTGRPRLHKSVLNRLLEPLQWHTMLFTLALPAHNFFAQRADPGAQPELRVCAEMMRELVGISEPAVLGTGQWHLPYLRPGEDLGDADPRLVSAARCARTSFLGQSVERPAQADVDLCLSKLIPSNHWSPFEHVATPQAHNVRWGSVRDPLDPGRSVEVRRAEVGKFPGWVQLRHLLEAAHGWDSYR